MPDMSGMIYFLFAGIGAILGLLFCVVLLLPLSLIWPQVWGASFWVVGGFTLAGLFWAAVIDR